MLSLVINCSKGYENPHIQPGKSIKIYKLLYIFLITKNSWNTDTISVNAVGSIYHSTEQRHYYFYVPFWKKIQI